MRQVIGFLTIGDSDKKTDYVLIAVYSFLVALDAYLRVKLYYKTLTMRICKLFLKAEQDLGIRLRLNT